MRSNTLNFQALQIRVGAGPEFEKGDGRLRPSLQQRLPGAEGPPEGCTTAPRHAACGSPIPSSWHSYPQYLDEVTWTTKSWLGLQKQRISVVLHTAIAEQIVNELACGEGGRVHGAKCLAVLAGVA